MFQTLQTVFDHISKHPEIRQKLSTGRRIFNSLLGVCKCGQTRSFVFDILFLNQPSLIKSCTISLLPCQAARCKGLFSSTVRARISALCSKNSSHSSRLPLAQAKWNGVIPLLSGQLTDDELLLSRSLEVSAHPWRAAKWSGVAPSASFNDGSALYSINVFTASKLL